MQNQSYKNQVALLLDVLPEVAKENCFAMHGGTAINLFVRDMPRLSVDIDLTYTEAGDRDVAINSINAALSRIASRLMSRKDSVLVRHRADVCKLQVSRHGVEIKLEVNLVGRGLIGEAVIMPLCQKAQEEFDAFVEFPIVPISQLYGGKVCAALDRQHPRDLFDVSYMLKTEGFSADVRKGFVYCLLGSDRPMNEVLKPNFQDQRQTMEKHFRGMSTEEFTYDDYEAVRETLVTEVNNGLTEEDRKFIMSVKNLVPDWSGNDYSNYPSIKWKIFNLNKLRSSNREKHIEMANALQSKLWPTKT
jgi:predicted nucleotidyltransferase component of viral defense system